MSEYAELLQRTRNTHAYRLEAAIHQFTENLCAEMERQQVSRAELAERLDSSRPYVTKVLRGESNFTLSSLVKLAAALDCRLELSLLSNCVTTRGSAYSITYSGTEYRVTCSTPKLTQAASTPQEEADAALCPAA